jgi:hypothetical protein
LIQIIQESLGGSVIELGIVPNTPNILEVYRFFWIEAASIDNVSNQYISGSDN